MLGLPVVMSLFNVANSFHAPLLCSLDLFEQFTSSLHIQYRIVVSLIMPWTAIGQRRDLFGSGRHVLTKSENEKR